MKIRTLLVVALLLGVVAVGAYLYTATAPPPGQTPTASGKPGRPPATAPAAGTKDEPSRPSLARGEPVPGKDEEDPNGYQRPCNQVTDKDLNDFLRDYRGEVEPGKEPPDGGVADDAVAKAGTRYYLRCTRKKTSAALEQLSGPQRQQATQVRTQIDQLTLTFRGLLGKAGGQGPELLRGELAREEFMDQFVEAMQPGEKQPPEAVVTRVNQDAAERVKGLRAAADRLSAANPSAAGDGEVLKRLASELEVEMRQLPPNAVDVINSYLLPYAQAPLQRPEYHPAGWLPPPPPPAAKP